MPRFGRAHEGDARRWVLKSAVGGGSRGRRCRVGRRGGKECRCPLLGTWRPSAETQRRGAAESAAIADGVPGAPTAPTSKKRLRQGSAGRAAESAGDRRRRTQDACGAHLGRAKKKHASKAGRARGNSAPTQT